MLLKNGRIVSEKGKKREDIRIEKGEIKERGKGLKPRVGERVMNLANRLIFPGFIDPHVHFQLEARGAVSIDDFFHGSISAAYGGVTTYIDYADQTADSLLAGLWRRQALAADKSVLDYNLHLVINNDFEPEKHLQEMDRLKEAGIRSIKLFTTYAGIYMLSEDKMEAIFKKAAENNILVTVHAEDDEIIQKRLKKHRREDKLGVEFHPDIRPAEAEKNAVNKIAELSHKTGATAYIVHLSSKAGYKAVKKAQKKGVNLLAETAPHYLLLNRDRYTGPDARLNLMTPPLREKTDNEALWQGLAEGSIEVVGTDHCAFTPQQKNIGNNSLDIYPGIPGVETLFPLLYSFGVKKERISISRLVEVLSTNAARLFGLYPQKGSVEVGTDADLVIFNPAPEWKLSGDKLHSLAGYTPYAGLKIKGQIEQTLLRGEPVVDFNKFNGSRGGGKFIRAGEISYSQ